LHILHIDLNPSAAVMLSILQSLQLFMDLSLTLLYQKFQLYMDMNQISHNSMT